MTGRSDHILAGEPLGAVTRRLAEVLHLRARTAIQPLREKASDHPVAWLKLADPGANRFDHPRAVRHQDPPIGSGNHPRRYQQIVIVQGGGVEHYADLACRRRTGVGKIDKLQIIQRTGFVDDPGFHHGALFSRGCAKYWPVIG